MRSLIVAVALILSACGAEADVDLVPTEEDFALTSCGQPAGRYDKVSLHFRDNPTVATVGSRLARGVSDTLQTVQPAGNSWFNVAFCPTKPARTISTQPFLSSRISRGVPSVDMIDLGMMN